MSKHVTIIGGSAAGLLTAKMLAEQGVNVKLFEAGGRSYPSSRTLIVTGHLEKVIGPLYKSALVNKIHRFELFTDGRVAKISLRHPDLIIERSKLLHELATQAQKSGVKIFTNHRFLNLKPNGEGLALTITSNGHRESAEQYAHILVGADGTFSKVAKCGGWPQQVTVPLIQAVVALPKDMNPDTSRVWFLPEETPYFYWLIPHSSTHGVLGLIAEQERQGRRYLEHFLEMKGITAIDFQSARIPLYTRWMPFRRNIGKGYIYLVGDAAGHVKATTVGGVVTGFRGALNVVDDILNNRRNLKINGLRRELGLHKFIRKSLHSFTQQDYVTLLDILNPSTLRSLSAFSRDETTRLLFHLFFNQPRLLLLGLRTILLDRLPVVKSN
jgi:flavin-dependent dehydrogenase